MRKFEVGKTYQMRSACDHECVWAYKVVGRTEKTITIENRENRPITRRISKYSEQMGYEFVYPLGNYSMSPILKA